MRCLAAGPAEAPNASARVLALNTVGALVGALATGYLVLPGLGFADAASAAAALKQRQRAMAVGSRREDGLEGS